MKKGKQKRPKEKMQLSIEFANNGIILRSPECGDEVLLAIHGKGTEKDGVYGYIVDHSEEYKAIGKKILDWLINTAIVDNDDWLSTGADLNIEATLTGRSRWAWIP